MEKKSTIIAIGLTVHSTPVEVWLAHHTRCPCWDS